MVKISTVNAIPVMTSNTAPKGFANASSVYSSSASNEAWKAFDEITSTSTPWWSNANYPAWISYRFENPTIIGAYEITASGTANTSPKTWTFEGSDDGLNWTVLDSKADISFTAYESKKFNLEVNKTNKYASYRLNITLNNGYTSGTQVASLKMYELIFEKKMIVRNDITNNNFSLDSKTLINLPSASDKNMILHGIESGKEIKLDEDFNKMKYVKDTSEVLGSGKKFTHVVDVSNTKVNKIIL